MWRLVLEGVSLHEIETKWSLEDVTKAIAILDMREDLRNASAEVKENKAT